MILYKNQNHALGIYLNLKTTILCWAKLLRHAPWLARRDRSHKWSHSSNKSRVLAYHSLSPFNPNSICQFPISLLFFASFKFQFSILFSLSYINHLLTLSFFYTHTYINKTFWTRIRDLIVTQLATAHHPPLAHSLSTFLEKEKENQKKKQSLRCLFDSEFHFFFTKGSLGYFCVHFLSFFFFFSCVDRLSFSREDRGLFWSWNLFPVWQRQQYIFCLSSCEFHCFQIGFADSELARTSRLFS